VTALWAGSPLMANALAAQLREEPLAFDPRSLKVLVYGVAVEIFGQTEAISCHRFWPDKWTATFLATS
jgi:hypothetical protein